MGSTGTRSFTYDGEDRQISANINGSTATYAYDGNGLRVSKTLASGATTYYAYDAFGNLAAEYGSTEPSPCGTSPCYLSWDHLGSMRMLTDSNGCPQRRYDYLPFGAEIPAGVDGRPSTSSGCTGGFYLSSPDDQNPKFTAQTRDVETTLDWFNVRYYSPAQGRFQSVDPANAGADPSDPQTWNAYAYVGNNPLSITDPSGEGWRSFFEDVGFFFANLLTGDLFNFGTPSINGTLGNLESIAGLGGTSEPWNEQPPIGPDIQDPGQFVFTFEDGTAATGQWVTDYKGDLVWVEGLPSRTAKLSFQGATLKAGPPRSNISVAGGCIVDAFKEHILGIGLATAAGPLPKVLVGSREIGSTNTTLLSKLGRYFNFRTTSPVYGPGARATTNALRGAGRILGPAALVINGAQLLKTGQDASACYRNSR